MARKVLIIDDDPEFVEAITNLLETKGYDMESAATGQDGIKKAEATKPDLILLDVMMATKSEGFDVARELHANENLKDIPVVMVTGVRKEMNLPFGFEADEDWLPVKEVLEKPIKPETLLRAVEQYAR